MLSLTDPRDAVPRDHEKRYKMSKMEWFGVVRGHSRSFEIAPFDKAHMIAFHSN